MPWVLNSGMQNFSHLLQGAHFQIGGWMKVGRKNVHFQRKTGHSSETVRDMA